MTWLYVPGLCEFSPCVQASADSKSAFNWPPAMPQELSLSLRGKDIAPASFARACKTGVLTNALSGLTLRPSMLDRGVAWWIASLQVFHASPSQPPASAEEQKTRATSGRTSPATYAQSSLPLSSAKTSQVTYPWGFSKCAKNYAKWATALRQVYLARQKLAHIISENDCSSLPTPTASRYGTQRNKQEIAKGNVRYSLETMATRNLWPTPRVPNGGQGVNDGAVWTSTSSVRKSNGDKATATLSAAVKMWPTPTVCGNHNRKGCSPASADGLATAVKQWPTPTSSDAAKGSPAQAYTAGGTGLTAAVCQAAKNLPENVTGQLAPAFVEWLMGFPLTWTEL